jgi:hypothetical protein
VVKFKQMNPREAAGCRATHYMMRRNGRRTERRGHLVQQDDPTMRGGPKRAIACGLANIVVRLLLSGTLLAAAVSPGFCRVWKPSTAMLAVDYTQIRDNRSKGEVVLVWWIVPQWVQNAQMQQLLDKYVVIVVAHGKPSIGGTFTFEDVDTLLVYADGDAKPLTRLTGDSIPPALAGFLATFGSGLRQSAGALGEGVHVFVFAGNSVHACNPGGLAVPFAGETYTFKTPIPGCAPA